MAAAAVTPSRLAALVKTRCTIFQTAYNPTSARTGAKYFRARLRGPSMVKYYPKDIDLCMSKFVKEWPELELVNFSEAQRLWDVDMKRARGKGAPAKAKDKSMSNLYIVRNITKSMMSRPESSDTKKTIAGRSVWITLHVHPSPCVYLFLLPKGSTCTLHSNRVDQQF